MTEDDRWYCALLDYTIIFQRNDLHAKCLGGVCSWKTHALHTNGPWCSASDLHQEVLKKQLIGKNFLCLPMLSLIVQLDTRLLITLSA